MRKEKGEVGGERESDLRQYSTKINQAELFTESTAPTTK